METGDPDSYHILNGFPVPRPGVDSRLRRRVVELSGRLAAVDGRYADWAGAAGVDHGALAADRRRAMIHELDAVVAHLYGLSREHLDVIFRRFHDGRQYEERLDRVFEYHERWADTGAEQTTGTGGD